MSRPRLHSNGGHKKSGGISKCDDRCVRTMLIHGARSVYFAAERDLDNMDPLYCKTRRIAGRRGYNKAVVAVVNQMARISQVILAKGVEFKPLRIRQGGSAQ